MDCLNCGNCEENQPTYYCLKDNAVVINEDYEPGEKSRGGWKKGSSGYENHRRQRKDVEV